MKPVSTSNICVQTFGTAWPNSQFVIVRQQKLNCSTALEETSLITLPSLPPLSLSSSQLYPQYTEGHVGEFTSGDEKVIVRDISLVVGSGTSMPEETEGDSRLQPLGLYNFKGSGSSLDNTHSNSSNEQLPQVGGLTLSPLPTLTPFCLPPHPLPTLFTTYSFSPFTLLVAQTILYLLCTRSQSDLTLSSHSLLPRTTD